MKSYRSFLVIVLSLLLSSSSLIIASFKENCSNVSETSHCDVQDSPHIFVIEALFANLDNSYPIELWENRDNEQMSIFEIAREIKSIVRNKDSIFNSIDERNRGRLFERLVQMDDIADRALIMKADKWKPYYVNELMKHIMGIRHYGISDLLPNIVDPSNCEEVEEEISQEELASLTEEEKDALKIQNILNPCDKEGKPWTTLASLGESTTHPSIAQYMRQHGTAIEIIKSWWTTQVSGSWEVGNRAVKVFYANQRTIDSARYYWTSKGYEAAEEEYEMMWANNSSEPTMKREELYIKAFTIWHAYVQEVLSKVKFYHNNQGKKEVCLIRTNGLSSLRSKNVRDFGRGYVMPSASYDSFSLINIYGKGKFGSAIIESSVPHHRILYLYPLLGLSGNKDGMTKNAINEAIEAIIGYYDANGLLILDKKDSVAVKKFVEEKVYEKSLLFKAEWGQDLDVSEFLGKLEEDVLEGLKSLSERVKIEQGETLRDAIMKLISGKVYTYETEFIVLSGPDLSFDYFYNTDEDLALLEEKLRNGDGVCKGYKLTQ